MGINRDALEKMGRDGHPAQGRWRMAKVLSKEIAQSGQNTQAHPSGEFWAASDIPSHRVVSSGD